MGEVGVLERDLLTRFIECYPFQPATAIWRAVEIGAVIRAGMPRGRVLDLGCGDGELTGIVSRYHDGIRWVGVDLDPRECEMARGSGLYEAVHVAPANAIPEADGSFDGAFSNSVLEHIDPIEPVLAEVARVLRSGAEFVFSVPSTGFHDSLRGPLGSGSRKAYLASLDQRLAHRYYFGPEQWGERLDAAGLILVECQPYLGRSQTRRWETVSRFTAGVLFRAFGGRLHPIEIQHRLGMRKGSSRIPRPLARVLSALLVSQHLLRTNEPDRSSCLLIRARRR